MKKDTRNNARLCAMLPDAATQQDVREMSKRLANADRIGGFLAEVIANGIPHGITITLSEAGVYVEGSRVLSSKHKVLQSRSGKFEGIGESSCNVIASAVLSVNKSLDNGEDEYNDLRFNGGAA